LRVAFAGDGGPERRLSVLRSPFSVICHREEEAHSVEPESRATAGGRRIFPFSVLRCLFSGSSVSVVGQA
jgi:hypothetical protein